MNDECGESMELTEEVPLTRKTVPETAQVVGGGVLLEVLGRDHELSAAEARRVVRHPRHRLTRFHLHVAVPVQPVVGAIHQLPAYRNRQPPQHTV